MKERAPWSGAVLAHGLCLLALFWALRLEKVGALRLDLGSTLDRARFFLPDLGFVLLFESLWLVVGGGKGRRAALAVAHLGVAALAVVAHSFFIATGYRLEIELLAYGLRHFAMLREIFSLATDARAALRFGGAALAALLPLALRRWRGPTLHRGSAVALLLAGLPPTLLVSSPPFAANDLWVLATSARSLARERLASRHTVAPEDFYRPPVLRSGPTRRPNLILVLLESTGTAVAAPWTPEAPTPVLARLAREGLRVEAAYAAVTHTSKALIGILCGVIPRLEMDIVETREGNLPIPCLPRLLEEVGYRTVFLQSAASNFENRPGLVRNLGFREGAYRETVERPPFERLGYFGLDDRALLEPALDWAAAAGETPFLMTLVTSLPHHPYQTPGVSEAEALAAPQAAHRRAIAAQDEFLGELVRGLEATGVLERSILIVLGDHGEAFGEHHRLQHDAVPYESVIRVPWVLYGPAWLGAPRAIDGLRHQVDLLPTVLGLLGVGWEGQLPGRDLLATPGHDLVASSCWYANTCVAARIGDTKVIYHFGRRPIEVFDLARDPGERHDLEPVLAPEIVREVEERLLGTKLSVDRFWSQYPIHDGPDAWWTEGAE